jgi:hypothetical protein
MWMLGFGKDDARPDRLGVVLEGAPGGWLFVIETRPGAYKESLVQEYMAAVRTSEQPATAIHVTPYGVEVGEGGGYWDGGEPANWRDEATIRALLESMK